MTRFPPAHGHSLRVVLILLLLLTVAQTAAAQFRVDVWTTEHGLPQNIVRAIHTGRDHYLWLTTLDGLVRFDGLRFTVFDRTTDPGIATTRFTALYESPNGDIWIGTEGGGVTHYSRGRFTTFTTRDGLVSNNVFAITGDDEDRIWVLSGDRIMHWDGRRFQPVETALRFRDSVWNSDVFWAVNDGNLHRFAHGHLTSRRLPAGIAGLGDGPVAEDSSGVWMTASNGRYVNLEPGDPLRVARMYRLPSDDRAPPPDESTTTYVDRRGHRWSIVVGRDLKRRLLVPGRHGPRQIGFATMYEDAEGNLWLGTEGQGLCRVRPEVVTTYSVADGLIDRKAYPILEDHAGAVWIGAWDRGLSRFDRGQFTNFSTKDGLVNGQVTALAEDSAHRLWVATRGPYGGLSVYERGRLTPVREPILPERGWASAIHEDRQRTLWFGTEMGLVRYTNKTSRIFTTADGLAANDVRVIVDAGPDRLWIGTYGGLSLFEQGRFTTWTDRDGLPSNSIRALYLDRDNVLWIGTYDGGLARFENGRLTAVTIRNGLFNNGVFQILEDRLGAFWMTSNRGIHRVLKQQLNDFAAGKIGSVISSSYGRSDGMLTEECNGGMSPAGIRARDGRLWLPTQDGVALIDPERVPTNTRAPTVLIESAAIDGSRVAIDDRLRVRPGQENVEISYTGISFVNAERLVFKYQLQGVDRDWVYAGRRRLAQYAYIPPGRYPFTVQAANSDGVWSDHPATLEIVVVPPFWKAWWFQTGAGAGAFGLLGAAYRRRITSLRRAASVQAQFSRQLIEAQESERQRIATELHDGLGQSLLIVKNRAMLSAVDGSSNPESAREQFGEIAGVAGHAIDEVRQIAYDLRPHTLSRLGLVRAVEEMVERLRAACPVRFSSDLVVLDTAVSKEHAIYCYRIIQECLSNIVRHAAASQASIQAVVDEGEVSLTIADDGTGFDVRASMAGQTRLGLGMTGIGERARILGGSHTIVSRPGAGTVVTIRFPAAAQQGTAS